MSPLRAAVTNALSESGERSAVSAELWVPAPVVKVASLLSRLSFGCRAAGAVLRQKGVICHGFDGRRNTQRAGRTLAKAPSPDSEMLGILLGVLAPWREIFRVSFRSQTCLAFHSRTARSSASPGIGRPMK